jgi:SAM-dependent methyltransferase
MDKRKQYLIDLKQQAWLAAQAVGHCLHVGCGSKPIPEAVNIDPNPDRAQWADFGYDVHELPFEDATFDSVVSSHVLNALEDIDQAMREMTRVLKPGGTMAHIVPDWSVTPRREDPRFPWQFQRQGWYSADQLQRYMGRYDYRLRVTLCEAFPGFHWSFRLKLFKPFDLSWNTIADPVEDVRAWTEELSR